MKSQRLLFFRLITFVLVPVLLLGILEAGSRLLVPGYSTDFTIKTVVDGVTVYRENDEYSWQFFPPEMARAPLVFSFPAEKAEGTYRIFVLGGSAAQGDPEPTYGFGRILELMLEHRYPDVHFEVINTALTAVNSHVVYQIAKEITPFQGDLFIIYLGHNEVVGPYGAGTIFAPFSPNLSFIRFAIFLRSSRLVQSLTRVLRLSWPEQGAKKEWRGMEMFLDQQVRADDPGMEKVYDHLQANLEDILTAIRRTGAKAIVSTVGTNLRDSAPFASQHRHPFPERERAQWDELYRKGTALAEADRPSEACVQLLEAEKMDDSYADLQFLLGRCHGEMGDYSEAMRRYRLAQDLDTLRFRADSRINEIIRDVAADRVGEGIFLVDAARAFAAESTHGIPGDDLFYEHVHMNFKGNYVLAKNLFRQMERILPPDMALPREGGDHLLTLEECMHGLALTGFDQHRISEEVLHRLEKPPFTNQLDHGEEMEKAQRREEELRAFTTPDALLGAARQYERALREDEDDPWLHYNFGMLQYASGNFGAAAEQFEALLRSLPHHRVAKERFLAALVQLGRFEEAVDRCREALRAEPDFHAARYTLAFAFSKMGREREAIAVYQELLQVDPERAPDIYNQLGQLHVRQGQYAEAALAFEEGLRISGDADRRRRPDMNYNLGVALKRDGRIEEASRAFSAAVSGYLEMIRRNPRSAPLHFALGSVYAEMGLFQDAALSFRMAVASNPADVQAHMHLARSLEAQGRLDEALEALKAGTEALLRMDRQESARELQRYQGSLQSKRNRDVHGTRR
jgi:tetratricopeptide (TPR) repeat protein